MYAYIEMRRVLNSTHAVEQFGAFARAERIQWRKRFLVACFHHAVSCVLLTFGAAGIGIASSGYVLALNGAVCIAALLHLHESYMRFRFSRDMLRRLPQMYRHGLRLLLQERKRLITAEVPTPDTGKGAPECGS